MSQNFGICMFKTCENIATVQLLRDDYFSKDWFGHVCEKCFDKIERMLNK